MKRLLLRSIASLVVLWSLSSCKQPSIEEPKKRLESTTSEQQQASVSPAVEELSVWATVVSWFI